MVSDRSHDHWVTVIETSHPDIYDGVRIGVFHDHQDAVDDLTEWLFDDLIGNTSEQVQKDMTLEELQARYTKVTGLKSKIDGPRTLPASD
jgi:hypothetical protein